jgi:hypothetical protein
VKRRRVAGDFLNRSPGSTHSGGVSLLLIELVILFYVAVSL